jgi:hypothetical protein
MKVSRVAAAEMRRVDFFVRAYETLLEAAMEVQY